MISYRSSSSLSVPGFNRHCPQIHTLIDQLSFLTDKLSRCHAHTTPGGHIGRHISIFHTAILSGKLCSSLSTLGLGFLNWLVLLWNTETMISERKLLPNWQTGFHFVNTRIFVHGKSDFKSVAAWWLNSLATSKNVSLLVMLGITSR